MRAAPGVVIIGGGAAGYSTAVALRKSGYEGLITLVGDEDHLPYDRPPLSKQVLCGEWGADAILLGDEAAMDDVSLTLRLGVAATGLDLANRRVRLSDGGDLEYTSLVIATGVSARVIPAAQATNSFTLRTMDDALGLKEHLSEGRRLVIVGAGFIGLEVAASARKLGVEVDVVEPESIPLGRRLTSEVGNWLREEHESRGVSFHLGTTVEQFRRGGDRIDSVVLENGTELHVDALLVCIGTIVNVGWLQGSGLLLQNGVVCDEVGRAADGVFAVGDVANAWRPGLGSRMRIEHRSNAAEQAAVVASAITGASAPVASPPSFWTDQYGSRLQLYGVIHPESTLELVDGDFGDDRWVGVFRREGALDAVLGKNAGRALIPYRRELGQRVGADARV